MLKKTIIASSILLAATASYATANMTLKNLITTNHSKFYIASAVYKLCSSMLPNKEGIVDPHTTKSAPWSDVTSLCKLGGQVCNAKVYAFPTDKIGITCSGGTLIADAALNMKDGSVKYTNINSNWTVPNVNPSTDGNVSTTLTYNGK